MFYKKRERFIKKRKKKKLGVCRDRIEKVEKEGKKKVKEKERERHGLASFQFAERFLFTVGNKQVSS